MSRPYLLVMPQDALTRNTFAFEHDMHHRRILTAMFKQSPTFTVEGAHNLLDPQRNLPKYHLDHARSHINAAIGLNVNIGHNLLDTNLTDPGKKTWWTFVNHIEHMVADTKIPPSL